MSHILKQKEAGRGIQATVDRIFYYRHITIIRLFKINIAQERANISDFHSKYAKIIASLNEK